MCVYIYIYIYICIYIYIYIYMNTCTYIYVYIHIYVYIYVCICICVHTIAGHQQAAAAQEAESRIRESKAKEAYSTQSHDTTRSRWCHETPATHADTHLQTQRSQTQTSSMAHTSLVASHLPTPVYVSGPSQAQTPSSAPTWYL